MPRKYMAASVPRFLRQTRLGYLPLKCVIGSRLLKGDGGINLMFDVIMLPVKEFQRMRSYVGMQQVAAPVPQPGGASFNPVFIPADTKQVDVPEHEPDPEEYARHHFRVLFGLLAFETSPAGTAENTHIAPVKKDNVLFDRAARSLTMPA